MNVAQLLAANIKSAHEHFSGTVADVTPEMAHWIPPGVAHPIGERIAHVVAAEDWQIHQLIQGGTPWFVSTWQGRTGFEGLKMNGSLEDARAVRVQSDALNEYMREVFADTEKFFDGLNEQDMERTIDMNFYGLGMMPLPIFTSAFVVGHLHDVMGEISALKGLQGAKGYPF